MITVYTGPMFSGKSTALVKKYQELMEDGKRNIICFKPSKDIRDLTQIRARNIPEKINAHVISSFEGILKWFSVFGNEKIEFTDVFIDEVQFIKGDFRILLKLSLEKGMDIHIAGLSLTNELTPFGEMPYILGIADEIIHLKAKCECGKPAIYTHCDVEKTQNILVGSREYRPMCPKCWLKHNKL